MRVDRTNSLCRRRHYSHNPQIRFSPVARLASCERSHLRLAQRTRARRLWLDHDRDLPPQRTHDGDLRVRTPLQPASRIGAFLSTLTLTLAGLALAGLAFTTDPTIRSTPATWHGQLHDLSFVILGLTLMPAMTLLGFAFQKDERWKNLSAYTWLTVALALPTFWLKGAAFYIFMLAVLMWSEAVALQLKAVKDQ